MENLKVLWLKRNPVRSVISFILAKKHSAWVGRQTKEMIEIDCQYLLRRLAFEDKAGKEARNALSRTSILDLDYEHLVSNSEKHLGGIQDFLGLPIKEVKTSLKRQNNKSLRDTVVNYDELASHINDSQWASYLTESR
ncbi:sulfotransferase [Akkermansiaceae bacterium]|nr:sulfotransferase [Akkermansiaceae bacterium]